jgi:vancomycin resistance protein VanW
MKNLPREFRRWISRVRRDGADVLTGRRKMMSAPSNTNFPQAASSAIQLSLEERIMPTESVEAKLHNLKQAAARVHNLVMMPGQIFSFWRVVGRPTKENGFQRGRSLLGGRLELDYGGGLCQLSGLLYQLSLQAGLVILERHAHSRDIYREEERYAPLGADATVAYGFKDFRIRNNTAAAICFRISVGSQNLIAQICSPTGIKPNVIEYLRTDEASGDCTVETRRWHADRRTYEVASVTTYRAYFQS